MSDASGKGMIAWVQVLLSTALAADSISSPAPRTVLQATRVAIAVVISAMLSALRIILGSPNAVGSGSMPAARQGFQARNELLRRGAAPVEQREEQTEMGKNVEPGSATGGGRLARPGPCSG